MSLPYMAFYIGDYLRDTEELTTEEHGAYLLILFTMWNKGGSLPNDPKTLRRVARVHPPHWARVAKEILPFFTVVGDRLTHKRIDKELKKARKKSEACSKSARHRRSKTNSRPHGLDTSNQCIKTAPNQLKNNEPHKANGCQPEPISVSPERDTGVITPEFPDLRKQVFDLARPTLVAQGEAKSKAGEIIGSWRKRLGNDDAALLGILADVIAQQPACLKTAMFKRFSGGGNGAHSPPASRRGRSSVFELSRDEARLVREEI